MGIIKSVIGILLVAGAIVGGFLMHFEPDFFSGRIKNIIISIMVIILILALVMFSL